MWKKGNLAEIAMHIIIRLTMGREVGSLSNTLHDIKGRGGGGGGK